jgi:hypothetical protein
MALLWLEGFEQYGAEGATGSALQTELLKVYSTAPSIYAEIAAGRHGGRCLEMSGYNSNVVLEGDLDTSYTTLICGFAFRVPVHTSGRYLFSWRTAAGVHQAGLWLDDWNRLSVTRYTTIIGTTIEKIVPNRWYYIEWKHTFDNTSGSFEVRLNGETVIQESGMDTYYNGYPSRFRFYSMDPEGSYDDFYVCDTSGTAFNDFLGPAQIETLLATSDSTAEWSPSSGTDHYALIDDMPDDSTGTYVESDTTSDEDLFGYANTTLDTVSAVQVRTRARNQDATQYDLVTLCDTGTAVTDTNTVTSTSYSTFEWILETAPGGGSWSATTFNAAEFGFRVG